MNGTTNCIICKTPVDAHTGITTIDGLVHPQPCHMKYKEMKKLHENRLNEGKATTLLEDLQPITMLMD